MTFKRKAAFALGGVVLILLYLIFLSGGNEYEDHDVADLDRQQLFKITEQLLEESEEWPSQLTAEGVEVSSSLEPYPVRAVRYMVEVEGDFEKAIAAFLLKVIISRLFGLLRLHGYPIRHLPPARTP